jgi:putative transposase
MPDYRRAAVPGGTFFFTLVSHERRPILCDDAIRLALREAITTVKNKHPFTIDAWVLLPDHLHCIWTLPPGDDAFSIRWSMIKRFVTQQIAGSCGGAHGAPYGGRGGSGAHGAPYGVSQLDCRVRRAHHKYPNQIHCSDGEHSAPVSASRLRRREGSLWQRRFWEHQLRDQADLNRCLDYLHWNPVKHGHVSRVAEWPYSTFHRFVREGMYPKDWGGQGVDDEGAFGE